MNCLIFSHLIVVWWPTPASCNTLFKSFASLQSSSVLHVVSNMLRFMMQSLWQAVEGEVNVFYPELTAIDSPFNLLTNQLRRLQVSRPILKRLKKNCLYLIKSLASWINIRGRWSNPEVVDSMLTIVRGVVFFPVSMLGLKWSYNRCYDTWSHRYFYSNQIIVQTGHMLEGYILIIGWN